MTSWKQLCASFAAGALLIGAVALAQTAPRVSGAGEALIGIYRIAPGKHMDFLKWMAVRDAIDVEAGVKATQWYAHMDGDSWDFIAISAVTSDAQEAKIAELTKQKGLKSGFAAGLELRQYIASHTDTFASGPQSAADLIKAAGTN